MKHPLICLDFDGVIFNSVEFVSGLPEVAKIGAERFVRAFREYRAGQEFLPESFAEFLLAKGLLTEREMDELIVRFSHMREKVPELVYADVEPFLSQFPKEMLAIVSRADPRWQLPNIRETGMDQRVSRVIVVQGDEGKRNALIELREAYAPIFLIDDNPKELEGVRNLDGVHSILLNRGKILDPVGGYKNLEEVARDPLLAALVQKR